MHAPTQNIYKMLNIFLKLHTDINWVIIKVIFNSSTRLSFKEHHHFSEADAFLFSDFNCLLFPPYSFSVIAIIVATEYKFSFNFLFSISCSCSSCNFSI